MKDKEILDFKKELKKRIIQVRNGGLITPHLFWAEEFILQALKKQREEIVSEIEGMRIKDKGEIILTLGNGETATMSVDSDRALLYNQAISDLKDKLLK